MRKTNSTVARNMRRASHEARMVKVTEKNELAFNYVEQTALAQIETRADKGFYDAFITVPDSIDAHRVAVYLKNHGFKVTQIQNTHKRVMRRPITTNTNKLHIAW